MEMTTNINNDSYTINNVTEIVMKNANPFWMILMDRSQLVMTIVGFLANIATSITLIKNGQVSELELLLLRTFDKNRTWVHTTSVHCTV